MQTLQPAITEKSYCIKAKILPHKQDYNEDGQTFVSADSKRKLEKGAHYCVDVHILHINAPAFP